MESISVLSWNVCRSLQDKLNDSEFVNVISKYDIICLYECWIESDVELYLEKYYCKSCPRLYGKGGGIVVFIRKELEEYCEFVTNVNDNIVVLELSGRLTVNGNNTYIFACYFPPVNSTYYCRCDTDLFISLEDLVSQYKNDNSTIIVTGDFNSRTSDNDDFIDNDRLNEVASDLLANVVHYMSDSVIRKRYNMDSTVNQFGRQLLTFCKTTSLRIVNGRHGDDTGGSITFYGARGSSLIDYLLVDESKFSSIVDFQTGIFNPFSDHSPITFSVKSCKIEPGGQVDGDSEIFETFKWNGDNTDQVVKALEDNFAELNVPNNSS